MHDHSVEPLLSRYSSDSESFDLGPSHNTESVHSQRWSPSKARLLIFIDAFTARPLGIRRRKQTSKRTRVLFGFLNGVVLTILLLIVISILDGIIHPSYASPPAHYEALEKHVRSTVGSGRGNPRNEKIFIASNIIQTDLIKGRWGASLIELVDLLGPENVFVSIYENDSGNSTSQALNELASRLPCKQSNPASTHRSA
jgi:hypothetical protein